jgi:stearoyl-CoA desaturase (delta-9 desaturase)
MSEHHFRTRTKLVRDWAKFPELVLLDRFDILIPVVFATATFALGECLAFAAPQLGTDGWQMFVWVFVISTVVLYHCTFTINSLAHKWGSKRFKRNDESRNNWLLAILTLGEGWHNNHHHYPHSARQGFYWWEIDITYSILWIMSKLGIVWDLKPVPQRVLDQGRQVSVKAPETNKAHRKDSNR